MHGMFLERLLGYRLQAAPGKGRVRRPFPWPTSPPTSAVAGLAHYKIPPRLRLMDTFPATVSGMAVGFRVAAARGTLRPGDEPDQRISVTRCSLSAAQLEFSTDTYTLAMLPPQLTQWPLP